MSEKSKGAIRGIGWSKFQHNIFYTGGGKNDKMLKMWNFNKKSLLKE